MIDPQTKVIAQVIQERKNQDRQWGGPTHDDEHGIRDWFRFIGQQEDKNRAAVMLILNQQDWGKVTNAEGEKLIREETRKRLIKIAALAVAAVESLDRKSDET